MTLPQLALFQAILFVASLIQGTVGFASGLFAIPILVIAGFTAPQAIAVNLVASLIQCAAGSYRLRGHVSPRLVLRPIIIRTAAIPLGAWVLYETSNALGQQSMKQIVGAVLLAILIVQWIWRVEPREKLAQIWEWIAFILSGFMAGFCGMGGPAMVLWVMAHRWTANKVRAFLFIVFLIGMIPIGFMLWWFFRQPVLDAYLLALLGTPAILAGVYTGLYLGAKLPTERLRQIIYILLFLTALTAIL